MRADCSFWNFDALFQPQQHPARDAHDTFFLTSEPLHRPPPAPRVLPVSPAYWPSDQLLLLYPHNRQFWHPAMTQYLPPWDQTDIPMKAPCAQHSGCLDIFT